MVMHSILKNIKSTNMYSCTDEQIAAFSNALRNLTNYIDAVGYRMGQENLEMMQEGLELSQDISDEMVSFLEDWAGGTAITA